MKPVNKWECPKCSKTLATKAILTTHLATHDPDAKVKCQICGKISKTPASLAAHMWSVHSDRERPRCATCDQVFSSVRAMRAHTEIAHRKKERPRFPCTFPGCEKSYLYKGHVVKHVQTKHAENPVRFPCTLCGKEFKTRTELVPQISTHTTEKPHNCATCGKGFARMGDMKVHAETHLEKSTRDVLQCHVCCRTFLSRHGLQNHIQVQHGNQRKFPCHLCGTILSTSSSLKRHIEAKHAANRELPHSCDKCEYRSYSKVNLANHVKSHDVANWRECYFCKKKYVTFPGLVKHCSRVHCLEK
ncbi:gastrula zinc finger protein XlCGF8.2DB-like [Folsomia candida]|uniref:gastrula zinc finger protein XlCGF8.2DB-like n=1 Tax=Folsomia candida TaxID=158441 RepID=UPI001604FD52|nr:gastrula zinc finger protein XlCGF8.2DB-like [Folsomia candida]